MSWRNSLIGPHMGVGCANPCGASAIPLLWVGDAPKLQLQGVHWAIGVQGSDAQIWVLVHDPRMVGTQ